MLQQRERQDHIVIRGFVPALSSSLFILPEIIWGKNGTYVDTGIVAYAYYPYDGEVKVYRERLAGNFDDFVVILEGDIPPIPELRKIFEHIIRRYYEPSTHDYPFSLDGDIIEANNYIAVITIPSKDFIKIEIERK